MKRIGTDMHRVATPTLEAGVAGAGNRAPAKTGSAAMSITELQMWSVPPVMIDNPTLDYAQANQDICNWLLNGTKPQSEEQIWEIMRFCVSQMLPNALSWLVLQCGLDYLDLSSLDLSIEHVEMIAGWLEHCPRPIYLNLERNYLGEEAAFALARALKADSPLVRLNLSENQISARGVEALADALNTNSTLNSLDIGFNDTDATSLAVLANALKTNSTLTKLCAIPGDSCKNLMGDAGAAKFADALKTNSTLAKLIIRSHEIGVTGAAALADALRTNSNLTHLDVAFNTFGDAGAVVLAEALKNNQTLKSLDVSNTGVGNAGIAALADALKTNSTLAKLNFGEGNKCDPEYADAALLDALQNNVTLTRLNNQNFLDSFEPVDRRLQVNRNAKLLALPAAAEAFMTLPTSWESKLPVEIGALIVKEMIVRAPVEGDGVEGLKSLVIASDIVKQRHCNETG